MQKGMVITMENNKAKTEELLCEMYRNLKMGMDNLCSVTPKIDDKFMLREVTGQLSRYAGYCERCESLMLRMSVDPKKPSAMKRAMARGGIIANTLVDSSDKHIAQMIARGTAMGADTLERTMRSCRRQGCSEEAAALCSGVIDCQRESAGRMTDNTV